MMKLPLNGTKTHPLTAVALSVLAQLQRGPLPAQCVNPGLGNRLERGGLVDIVGIRSPFKSHKGRKLAHYQITDAGRALLAKGKS